MASGRPKERTKSIMFGCPEPAPTRVPGKGTGTKLHTVHAASMNVTSTRYTVYRNEQEILVVS
jgi:hypothetical protein